MKRLLSGVGAAVLVLASGLGVAIAIAAVTSVTITGNNLVCKQGTTTVPCSGTSSVADGQAITVSAVADAPSLLVGDANVEATTDSNGSTVQAWQYTAGASGTAASISAYVASGTNGVSVGLYSDASGQPGTLLDSGTVSAPHAGAWNAATLTKGVQVTAGTKYWLAWAGNDSFRDAASGSCAYALSGATSLSSTFSESSGGTGYCPASLQVDGTAASTSTSTTTTTTTTTAASTSSTTTTTPPPTGCDVTATPSNFASQVAAASSGQTVCLATGNYGTWSPTTTKTLTIMPQSGASPNFCFDIQGSASNITIDGGHTNYDYTTAGMNCSSSQVESGASNITIKRMAWTTCPANGYCIRDFSAGPVTIEGNIFHDMLPTSNPPDLGATGAINEAAGTDSNTTVIQSNLFENMCPDGVDPWDGHVQIIGNDFLGMDGSNPNCVNHTDAIQYSGPGDVIEGNLVLSPCTQGIDAFDGSASNTIRDNVIDTCTVHSLVAAGDNPGSTIDHNTVVGTGNADIECGSKPANSTSLTAISNNIAQDGVNVGGINGGPTCTPSVNTHNIGTAGVTFAGGASPTTYAGFALAAGSAGKGAATDGTDIGARPGNYPRPAGLP